MKKLMITATVALCAAVGSQALDSANVVGYTNVEAPAGDSMRCATFKIVGGSGYDLTNIKVTGGYGMGDICAQTLTSDGLWAGQYYWLTVDGAGVAADGWYEDMVGDYPVAADQVVLAPGEALSIHSDYEDLTFSFPAVLSAD